MAEAIYRNDPDTVVFTAAAALASGQVIQLPDGRAGVVEGLRGIAAGEQVSARVRGVVEVAKTASIALLQGMKVFWDRSANKAHFLPLSGDFYMGFVHTDAAGADSTVKIVLNEKPNYLIDFDGSPDETLWTHGATNGEGVTAATPASRCKLSFDAVAEAAMAALYPAETVKHTPIADLGIVQMRVGIFDIGDDAALDINFGLANGTHATDADAIAESVFFHLDGAALSVLAESDDGTTEVAATDTTVDAVDDTFADFWIDARDPSDIQLYINGVNVLPASVFKLNAATGPVFPIIHVEKTTNDTTMDVRVEYIRQWSTD